MEDAVHVLLEQGFTVFGQKISHAELFGQIFALTVVFLAQRRSLWTWPVQLASVALLFTVYLSAHLGGLATRQVVVGLIAVYGWYAWARRRDPVFGVVVRKGSVRERLAVGAAFVVGTVVFALVLDALQGLGLVEFWLVWLVVDAIGVPLQIKSGLWFSASIYVVFAALVIHGWFDWNRAAKRSGALRPATSPAE
jgi:nicotinamide mononucleotide transporter